MRLYFPQYFESESRFMTYTIVARIMEQGGHVIADDPHGCDAALYSMCDVEEYPGLVKLRRQVGDLPIIVGGAFAFNFWSAAIYADCVWVGEVFEMAECRTLDELMASPHVYTPGDALPVASTRIDWGRVPVCQIAPKKAYYWGGVGCKNKCRFCFTSWTHIHQINSPANIQRAKVNARAHKIHLMIASNEYEDGTGGTTQDMMLVDYIRRPVKASLVRCGIEFATDESRARMGKRITRDDIYKAIQKMNADGCALRFFHISGYDTREDWERYIGDLCVMLERHPNRKMLHLMFNNLQYQNYTPLYAERRGIDPARYIDHTVTAAWYDRLRQHSMHVLVGAPSPFQHVACRMGVELSRTREQVDFWLDKAKNPKGKMTVDQAHRALMDSGVLDTPHLRFDFKAGAIKEWGAQ